MAGDVVKPALPGIVGLVAGVPNRAVSGPLADRENECIP
jgi:hypothetical protein